MFTSHLLSLPVFHWLWVCVCVAHPLHLWCVILDDGVCKLAPSATFLFRCSFDCRPPEPAVTWFLWTRDGSRLGCVNVWGVLPVAELLVLRWPRCVCVWNWMTRIQRCYCNRGGSDGGAVSLCINTFIKPLLKTDDCSCRAQWISVKGLECSIWSCAIVMMETQLKNVFLHKLSVHYVSALSVPKLLQFLQ